MRVALIPGMPVDLLDDLSLTSSGETTTANNHNLMVMTRQQKCQQVTGRQKNQATAVTASDNSTSGSSIQQVQQCKYQFN